jgi:preprotein translocase subunit YajC
MKNLWILAQADENVVSTDMPEGEALEQTLQPGEQPIAPAEGQQSKPPFNPMILLIVGMVVIMFISMRGPKKKQKQHKEMVNALEKNDRVRTIGGIIGTVIDVKDDEITLKVDESNNTKMKFTPNAIAGKVSQDNA